DCLQAHQLWQQTLVAPFVRDCDVRGIALEECRQLRFGWGSFFDGFHAQHGPEKLLKPDDADGPRSLHLKFSRLSSQLFLESEIDDLARGLYGWRFVSRLLDRLPRRSIRVIETLAKFDFCLQQCR